MRLLTVEDVMEITQYGRKKVIQLLNTPGCPTLPRTKFEHYRVPETAFYEWLTERGK